MVICVLTQELDENLYLSTRNIPSVAVCDVEHADPVSLVGFDKTLLTVEAVQRFEELLG